MILPGFKALMRSFNFIRHLMIPSGFSLPEQPASLFLFSPAFSHFRPPNLHRFDVIEHYVVVHDLSILNHWFYAHGSRTGSTR